ncbi:hypothetical protein NK553_22700 [Pseudomonas sp. ZM23]|uniref:Uncharacterized protein n=1 Tax=Pseudomonas triclosanedens TaxID=2961893 RepID=A0ABY6ZZ78_9PSED|nr:hypothetical protein [Pseudomonas triclosanedens]MCP8466766.1 hypothetical protein [Pseudomonas triclosanedens]MCP8469990.1 hypothetical protein [Pseudomonas triclosanedens]MCP8477900.1 hypothetical protein [Pseudomonas triclosanedens]WAI49320.1 hypothetical protein OU419_26875 [Pseudomonas triclosanedens]
MRISRIALLAALFAGAVQASSDGAWQAQDKLQRESCLALSHLQNKKILGAPVLFDDSVGYTALMIGGRYSQKGAQAHMKGKEGRELCLFQRSTGKATISEADSLLPPK